MNWICRFVQDVIHDGHRDHTSNSDTSTVKIQPFNWFPHALLNYTIKEVSTWMSNRIQLLYMDMTAYTFPHVHSAKISLNKVDDKTPTNITNKPSIIEKKLPCMNILREFL